jgi:hypothetical protein
VLHHRHPQPECAVSQSLSGSVGRVKGNSTVAN